MGHYGLGHWRVLSLASDFRAVWLVWLKVGERASGKAFGAKTLRLMRRLTLLLDKVWRKDKLEARPWYWRIFNLGFEHKPCL